jgi:hypothetical protein
MNTEEDWYEQTRGWYIGHLERLAESLAMEDTLDQLAWRHYYRWIIECFGTDEDKKKAGIKQEEEE